MKSSLILACLLTLPAAASAATIPAVEVSAESLTVACTDPQLPSQADVGRVLGTDNLGETYAARSRLMVTVRQACKAGYSRLVVRRDPESTHVVVLAMR